jgi:hypothetical protein
MSHMHVRIIERDQLSMHIAYELQHALNHGSTKV